MKRPLTLERATRAVLRGERHVDSADEDLDPHRGVRAPKITLPKLKFLERPLPDWWNELPPKPARKKDK